jgi:hypothetical protein
MSAQNISADWPATTDEQVMLALKAGSVDAFEVLYDRYHERASQIARAICHTEIAARLDLPPGTVKGRIRLGLQRLRVEIER